MLLRRTGRSPRWRYFSLTQVNSGRDDKPDGWTLWSAPESEHVHGRAAFRAAEAARRQDRFDAMHVALLQARHEDKQDLDDPAVLEDCARAAGLDQERFERDLAEPDLLDAVRRDHEEAVERYKVFGTPTFVGESGQAFYLRLREVPEGQEAERAVSRIEELIDDLPYVLEVKRPA